MDKIKTIAVARGDGIGPELTESVLLILEKAGADLKIEHIEIGANLYQSGYTSGISEEAWEIVKRNKVLLKAPITTPQGEGYKSLNVTFRKELGLFANVRPVQSFQPFIKGANEKMDIVIIRENEEDLYAGIEYRTTASSYLALKLISRAGCERIIRYAFQYAKMHNRSKVTCMVKDNIMKMTDGLFHSVFKEVAVEYPEIEAESYIVDIGAARVASKPSSFDVIVTLNLYGDIISDIAAEASGSVGLAGSANIGLDYAMFEAVHGSAPKRAGQNVANPSGFLNAAVMMLDHIGQHSVAAKIKNAWLKTIEDGLHTRDIFCEKSSQKLSTSEFTQAVISNLGHVPTQLKSVVASADSNISVQLKAVPAPTKELVGVDIYLMDHNKKVAQVVESLSSVSNTLQLDSIAHRGLLVWPASQAETECAGMMRLRFMKKQEVSQSDVLNLLQQVVAQGFEVGMNHMLYQYDGVDGFSKAQGE